MQLTTDVLNNLLKAAEKCKASQDPNDQFTLAMRLQDIQAELQEKKSSYHKTIENQLYHLEKVEDVIRYNLNIIMFITCTRQFLCPELASTPQFIEIFNLKSSKKKETSNKANN